MSKIVSEWTFPLLDKKLRETTTIFAFVFAIYNLVLKVLNLKFCPKSRTFLINPAFDNECFINSLFTKHLNLSTVKAKTICLYCQQYF